MTAFSAPLTPPWYEVTLNTGTTGNLFADSMAIADQHAGVGLLLEQMLHPDLAVWYQGYGETFSESRELGSLNHTLALEAGKFVGERGEVWVSALGGMQQFRSDYELYNRQSGSLIGGYRHLADKALRLRVDARLQIVRYPNVDSTGVNYRQESISGGVNASFRFPLSLDVEPGLQRRHYPDLSLPTTTRYFWLSMRATTPLNPQTGLVIRGLLRDQLTLDGTGLIALMRGGLDPGDMLWDGWQGGVSLNRMQGATLISLSLDTGHAEYAQSVLYTGLPARADDFKRATLRVSSPLLLKKGWGSLRVTGNVEYMDNRSTVGYYEYAAFSGQLSLRVSAP